MTLDLFHANIEAPDIGAASIRAAGVAALALQVADTTRRGLGEGHLDLGRRRGRAGRSIDYGGALVVEIMAIRNARKISPAQRKIFAKCSCANAGGERGE